MALSYDKSPDSNAIAMRKYYKNKERNKLVYYTENNDQKPITKDDITLEHLEFKFGKTETRYAKNHDALKEKLIELINDDLSNQRPMQTLKINDSGEFIPLVFNLNGQRWVIYVSGMAGSGKSTWSRQMIKVFSLMGIPKSRIFFICNKEDPEFAKMSTYVDIDDMVKVDGDGDYETQMAIYKEKKIKFKHRKSEFSPEEQMEMEIALDKMKPTRKAKTKGYKITKKFEDMVDKNNPTLFVLDDIEAFDSIREAKSYFLANYIAVSERKNNVNMIVIQHHLTNSHKTRTLLNESTDVVVFKKTQPKALMYFMRNYLQWDKSQTQRLMSVHKELSRFGYIMINRTFHGVVSNKIMYLN